MRAALLAVLLATACGSHAAASGDPPPSPTVAANVLVTMAAKDGTVIAHLGDHVQIALGEQYRWELDPPDGVILARTVQNYMLVRGTQAIWLATAPGRTTIRATGGAVCPGGSPCPLFAVLFSAAVEVLP